VIARDGVESEWIDKHETAGFYVAEQQLKSKNLHAHDLEAPLISLLFEDDHDDENKDDLVAASPRCDRYGLVSLQGLQSSPFCSIF
jgi:hypothetical protein